jgi:hypothetical protein
MLLAEFDLPLVTKIVPVLSLLGPEAMSTPPVCDINEEPVKISKFGSILSNGLVNDPTSMFEPCNDITPIPDVTEIDPGSEPLPLVIETLPALALSLDEYDDPPMI